LLISAVILSFNSAKCIETCVRLLTAALARWPEPSEIWVVENGSTDGSVEILRRLEEQFLELHVIYCAQTPGRRFRGMLRSTGHAAAISS
jgi:glycosyltransferase involved in cell wall biosynthesis